MYLQIIFNYSCMFESKGSVLLCYVLYIYTFLCYELYNVWGGG